VFQLPVSLFPRTTFPRVVVSADAGDRPADRMVIEVTRLLEEAVRSVPGIRTLRSTTSRGSCEISANFRWGQDMIATTLEVQSAIARILPDLPPGIGFEVRRMDPTVFPVIGLSLTSSTRSLVELRDLGLYDLRPVLSAVDGVAKIDVLGGHEQEYHVLLSPERLESADLTLAEVVAAVSATNVVEAVGRLEQDEKLYLVLSDTQFHGLDDLSRVVVRHGATGDVLLSDVATVEDAAAPAWTRVTAEGRDAVLLNVYQQPDGNTTQIARDVDARLADFRQRVGTDVAVHPWYDQSVLIDDAAASVRDSIVIGVLLAVAVLLLFLRNARITLVVSLSVPVVLAITALALLAAGRGLNIMTLGGMAAAVGLIVDDGIVMVEHVVRRLRDEKGGGGSVLMRAAHEMLPPLTASSLATIVIFVPLAFLSGVTGAFFKALSLTMAIALAVSYAFAALAVPVLSGLFLSARDAEREDVGRVLGAALRVHAVVLDILLRRKVLALAVVVPLALLGWIAYRQVGTGFMPAMDEGGFVLDYRAPAGTSLDETDRRLRLVEGILAKVPDVRTWSRRTGLALGGGITEANEGDFFVRLKPQPRRPIEVVMDDVRGQVLQQVPGLDIEILQLMEDLIGDLTAVPQPIEIQLLGASADTLRGAAEPVAAAIERIPGVVDVKSGVVLAGDALDVRVDRLKAEMLGLDPEAVTRIARIALAGEVASQVQRGEKMIGVRIWTRPEARASIERVARLRLRTPEGASVPLGRIATLETVSGQPQIVRENLETMVAVTGRIAGRDLGSVIRDVRAAVEALPLPAGVHVEYGGLYRQQQESFRGLLMVLVAAIGLVFVLLLYVYERFAAPVAILAVDLLAIVGVFVGLWWTGTELNISSMMGLTMIVGISSEAAIFYMTGWREATARLDPRAALIEAGRLRFRPISMTALAAILALAPLAVAIGQGSAMLQPLAIAIISGLVLTVPLVLVVLPVLFALLGGTRQGA
jgi:multidrug efflux pump subunit AcrB